jgi:hypothetical protein
MMQSTLETGNKISVFKEYYPYGESDFKSLSNKIACYIQNDFAKYIIFDSRNRPLLIREVGPTDNNYKKLFSQEGFLSLPFAKSVFIFHASAIELVPEGFSELFKSNESDVVIETQAEGKKGRVIYRAQFPQNMPDVMQWETKEIGNQLVNLLKHKKNIINNEFVTVVWEQGDNLNLLLIRNNIIQFGHSFYIESTEEAFYFTSNVLKQMNVDLNETSLIFISGKNLNETFQEIAKKYISSVQNINVLWGNLNLEHPECKFDLSQFGILLNVEF